MESHLVSPLKVDFKILIRSDPDRVYDAMTTAEGLDGSRRIRLSMLLRAGPFAFAGKTGARRNTKGRTEGRYLKQFGQVDLCFNGSQIQDCLSRQLRWTLRLSRMGRWSAFQKMVFGIHQKECKICLTDRQAGVRH